MDYVVRPIQIEDAEAFWEMMAELDSETRYTNKNGDKTNPNRLQQCNLLGFCLCDFYSLTYISRCC